VGYGRPDAPDPVGNHYGWFERVDRGVYRLSPGAVDGLAQWPRVADAKRALLPAEVVRP
jgi:hypothetical protein